MASHQAGGAKREEKGRNIQVVVRCRPFNTMERKSSYGVIDCDANRKEVIVRTGGPNDKASRKTYTFDMVFGPAAKQIEVYRSVVCPILDEVIMGYNCTVFAYGQTGTGKTFTMEGERSPNEQFTWEEDPLAGIIPRTLHQIFEKLSDNGTEFSVKVSLLEIYNEELFDLLSPSDDVSERLLLFDDPRNKRGVVVKGLEEVTVHNKDEVYQILERGAAKRRTASTLMNAYSSRSHSVFSVTIHMKETTLDGEELVKIGKLNLVDLAGSENIGRSGAVDKRAREAGNINQSLLTLGRVITALVEKRPHVPYRESKLTRILQDSLGGRTKTSIIATVSPSSSNVEETLSTLEYASRAKNIMNKPEVNQKLTKRTLIKEYTEEIERLKRDLAATRDKNGVYVSAENYETMMGQISSQEALASEYTERIAELEEELKKLMELFTDSKTKLDQCSVDLEENLQRLEETNQDLRQTKEKLSQEEFISAELGSIQETLHSTAGQLLHTADASTSDVSGLHDKLDRKRKVEQHNRASQQSFAQQMDGAFCALQRCVQQQAARHGGVLSGYSKAVDGLLTMNQAALEGGLSSVRSLMGGVSQLVADGVRRCQAKVQQQEVMHQQDKEKLLLLLEEHKQEMEEALTAQTLEGLSAVREIGDGLQAAAERQRDLANQVEAMKEVGVAFRRLGEELGVLRDAAVQNVIAMQTQRQQLEAEIRRAQERHQEGMRRTIQCLQDQLQLQSLETQQDYAALGSASRSLEEPLQVLQENISSGCAALERRSSAHADLLSSSCSSLASSLHLNVTESQQMLKELMGRCSRLQTSVCGLVERDLQWSSRTQEEVETQTQARLSLTGNVQSEAQNLQQDVETLGAERLLTAEEQLAAQQEAAQRVLLELQNQTRLDRTALDQQGAEIQDQVETSRHLVHRFLQEELQQDLPTGATPPRRDFVYPKQLMKLKSRPELLENLRRQQEELRAAIQEEEEEEEDLEEDKHSQVERDSLEEELSTYNESLATEPSFIDENLVFNESNRRPFFKKKGNRKEQKNQPRPKVLENDSTPPKSRLPLRCQN
ncbi:kinesin-like protein KIF11 isoform X2 [Antennarius striatus]|uniref:kinesin-like protein KIF11 isoform X2 n=1 Tax=Antennarius striatus TaxID=241820 RepID=UPI0035B0547D